jgi:Fic family protein
MVAAPEVTVEHVLALHRALLPGQPQHHGLRTVQNWLGGSARHPLDADFVPPDHEAVPALMADLVDYVNGASHAPLVQAALVHAQFETIHPFTDGNGRVGRALIHTVMARRGLTSSAVLPISLVLATLRDGYVDGLTAYRHDGDPAGPESLRRVRDWIATFTDAAVAAVGQSIMLVEEIEQLRLQWAEQLHSHRAGQGMRETPRADSATARLLMMLPEAPVVTATTLIRILNVSHPAASAALDELRQAGILQTRKIERNTTAYLATEILDLITLAERRLASTRFDTRTSAPNRSVPALPDLSG